MANSSQCIMQMTLPSSVGGNRAEVLGHATGPVDDMEALKQVVSQLGYELRKNWEPEPDCP